MMQIFKNLILLIFTLTSLVSTMLADDTNVIDYVVTAKELNIRELPKANAKVLGAYNNGDKIIILDQTEGWSKTDQGWVFSKHIKKYVEEETSLIFILFIVVSSLALLAGAIYVLMLAWPLSGLLLIPLIIILLIVGTPIVIIGGLLYYIVKTILYKNNFNEDIMIEELNNINDPGEDLTSEEKETVEKLEQKLELTYQKLKSAENESKPLRTNKDGSISQRSNRGKELIKILNSLGFDISNIKSEIINVSNSGEVRQKVYQNKIYEITKPARQQNKDLKIKLSFHLAFVSWSILIVSYFIQKFDNKDIISSTDFIQKLFIQYINFYNYIFTDVSYFDYQQHLALVFVPIIIFIISSFILNMKKYTIPKYNNDLK